MKPYIIKDNDVDMRVTITPPLKLREWKGKMNKQLKQEAEKWKETYEIFSNKEIMKSIDTSLKQIAQGKGIPLSQFLNDYPTDSINPTFDDFIKQELSGFWFAND